MKKLFKNIKLTSKLVAAVVVISSTCSVDSLGKLTIFESSPLSYKCLLYFKKLFYLLLCRGGRRNVERKGPDLRIRLSVTLEDIYNGSEVPFYLTK